MLREIARELRAVVEDDRANALAEYALISLVLGASTITAILLLQSAAGAQLNANASGWLQSAFKP